MQLEVNTNRLVIKVVLVCVCLCLNHFSGKPWCVFRLCPNIFNEGWGCEALCVKPAPVNVYNRILMFLCLSGLFFLKTFALTEAILTLSDVQPAPAGPQMIYDHNLLMHFSTFTEPSPCCEPRS